MSEAAKYQVIERIDAGGMAEVFKANSSSMQGFEKLVAIKRILPELTKKPRFVRMFLDEAKVSLHLNHNNCVQIFDLGRAGDTYFIVMEFVDGTNLKHIIENIHQSHQVMPIEQAVYIAIEICKGLAHAHQKCDLEGTPLQIVHRDISPPNVLVSLEGEVKITDFGLAKAQSQVEVTDPGVVKGKFGYLSPEAAEGEMVDQRTDIFAVGILLWEMLVGQRLFLGKTDYDTLGQVQRAKFKPPSSYRSDIPIQLEQIVERALAKDPNRRYQHARELAEALSQFLFSYGRSVTSFDIARHVVNVRKQHAGAMSSVQDSGVQAAVQNEINKMASLEDVDDLDAYLADHYNSMSSRDDIPVSNHSGDFEDPSQWADFGLGNDSAPAFGQSGLGGEGSEGWQEADLGLLLSENSGQMKALTPPGDEEFGQDATTQLTRESLANIQVDRMRAQTQQAKMQAQQAAQQQAAQNLHQYSAQANPQPASPAMMPQEPAPYPVNPGPVDYPQPVNPVNFAPVDNMPAGFQPPPQAESPSKLPLIIVLIVLLLLGIGGIVAALILVG